MSENVITFRIQEVNLAVEVEYVRNLEAWSRVSEVRKDISYSIGHYDNVDGDVCSAIELMGECESGKRYFLMFLRVGEKICPLRADSVGRMRTVEGFAEMPPIRDTLFQKFVRKAFYLEGELHFVVNVAEVSDLLDFSDQRKSSTAMGHSKKTNQEFQGVDFTQAFWFQYLLLYIERARFSGRIFLKSDSIHHGLLGLTAGNLTYASMGALRGIDAVSRISESQWESSEYSRREVEEVANLDLKIRDIIEGLKQTEV